MSEGKDKDVSPLELVRRLRTVIEGRIRDELQAFTDETGIVVSSIDVGVIETTRLDDGQRRYGGYQVSVDLELGR